MNYISPCNHPESDLSGSTIESMIDRAKDLGLKYFAATDLSSMSTIIRGYNYANKKDIKLIAGMEILFKDPHCDIIEDTESSQIKYFKLLVHALDQESYQGLVKMLSQEGRQKIAVGEDRLPSFDWSDLEKMSKLNVLACTSNLEDMVSKHLIVNRADLSVKYYEKLKQIFGDRLYLSIIPYSYDKFWESIVEIELESGKTVRIPAQDRVETNHYKNARAIELTRRNNKHKELLYVYLNRIRYKVKDEDKAIKKAKLLNDFQPISDGDIQTKANKLILALASRDGLNDRLLVNSYSYYAKEGDQVVQSMKLGETERFDQKQYMRSTEESREYLTNTLGLVEDQISSMIDNSNKWASKFDNFNLKYEYRLPNTGENPKQQLIDIINKVGRMDWKNQTYVTQFKEELELLSDNGVIDLIPYFLPIVDVYDSYKENGYLTGPARGSAGGFLISYLLGITHIDPIKYELSSSRFLTIDRVKQGNLPDIDCDLESRDHLVGRDGNGGFLFNKYGNKAAQVSTRTLLRVKSAILDANRFVNKGKVEAEVQALSKSLPTTPQGVNDLDYVFGYDKDDGSHVLGLLEVSEDLQKYAEARPVEWDIVKRALSLSRQKSRHACAYVVADVPIEDVVPVEEIGGVNRVTSPEAKHCEWAGLIKYDFLVVKAVKTARVCLDYINEKNKKDYGNFKNVGWYHPESDAAGCMECEGTDSIFEGGQTPVDPIYKDDPNSELTCERCDRVINDTKPFKLETGYFRHNDKATYVWDLPIDQDVFEMMWKGHTETVFQLHSSTATPLVMDIKPESIVDCAVITSLGRPGPLDYFNEHGRNMAEEYGFRKRGESSSHLQVMHDMLPETHGVLVFQEQVTKLAKELAGMNVIDAENVRIAVGKKKKKLIESLKPIFIKGASEKIGLEQATEVWDMMETFARYGFNKSHAVAYCVISYACAFFKHHYPLEWWASVLSTSDSKKINEEYYKYVKDMILPPDINISTERISIDYGLKKLRSKLSMINGLGKKSAHKIISNRPYINMKDFVEKKVAGPSLTRKLIHVGVLDSLMVADGKTELMSKLQHYEDTVKVVEWQNKVRTYKEKLDTEVDPKKIKRLENSMDKLIKKGATKGKIHKDYQVITPKKSFLMKKSVFPSILLDLNKALSNNSDNLRIMPSYPYPRVLDQWGRETALVSGEHLQRIDEMDMQEGEEVKVCCPAYVIDSEEFTFANGEKKALKLILDSSGYTSEKVLWADYNTGELIYPETLKKGAIVYVFYKRKMNSKGKNYTNITNLIIEDVGVK